MCEIGRYRYLGASTLVLVLLLLAASNSASADWPTYLHDNARVAATDESLSLPLALNWVHSAPAKPRQAWSGPRAEAIEGHKMRHRVAFDDAIHVVAVADRAYFGSSVDHHLYCVNAATGNTVWKFATGGPIRLAPTVARDKVYFGSDDGLVYCLTAEDGKVVWQRRVGPVDERLLARGEMISRWPVRTGVLIDGELAYFGAGIFPHENVYLVAAKADTGEIVWLNDAISQQDAGRNDLSPQGYLLSNDEQLFVPSGRSLPAAFSRATGKMTHKRKFSWRTTAGGVVGGTKAILADGQIYSSGAHHFLALDQKSGDVGFAWVGGRQMTLAGNMAYVATDEEIVAVDRKAYAAASRRKQEIFLAQRELTRNYYRKRITKAIYSTAKKVLEDEEAKLAKQGVAWRTKTKAPVDRALALTGNVLFAGGESSVLGFDLETGEQVWSAKVEGTTRGLAVANGRLFASTTAGKIYTFGSKETVAAATKVAEYPAEWVKNPFAELDDDEQLSKRYAQAAEEILQKTEAKRGFCLVLGSNQGRLAYELATRTKLQVIAVEEDAKLVAQSRELLRRSGLYGPRITVIQADPSSAPVSNYFANLVVSDETVLSGKLPATPEKMGRFVKPVGGQLCVGVPTGSSVKLDPGATKESITQMYGPGETEVVADGSWLIATRGKLPGAGEWSHQYGNVANTNSTNDTIVKGGMSVLWYGDPGPGKIINRHEAAAAPLSTNGRMFVQGTDSVRAYDAYNGLFLWEFKNPGALRTGVFNNEDTSNLAASQDALFVAAGKACFELDAATGKVRREHKIPEFEKGGLPRVWSYVAVSDGQLFGTSSIRRALAAELRRRGRVVERTTDAIFAVDTKTGKREWTYQGKNILHVTIAIDGGRVFFIDSSFTKEDRETWMRQQREKLAGLTGDAAKKAEEELKKRDVRLAVCIDASSGKKLWETPVDVTDCSHIGIGGGNLTLMAQDDNVLICGANANGHYWRQFLSGEFSKRRLLVLDAKTGQRKWAKDANYRHRPIIVGKEIFAEPWAFDLASGKMKMRQHPVTGEETPWQFSRPGHHCGAITATPNMLLFRSGFTGYYDLYSDSGTSHFAGHRLGCWVNAIPGNGLVMMPESSAGCVCQFSITATVVMEPRKDRRAWGIYSAAGSQLPVKQLALNLGAPGDRRDGQDQLWLSYPRPSTVGRLEYDFDLAPRFVKGGDFTDANSESISIAGTQSPWLYVSAASGLTRIDLPLRRKNDPAATYQVKLHFAETDTAIEPGERVFGVQLQGVKQDGEVDIVKDAGGNNRALVRTFDGIVVDGKLRIELVPREGSKPPTLAAIEVTRQAE